METTPTQDIQKATSDVQKAGSSVKNASASVGNYVAERGQQIASEVSSNLKGLHLDEAYGVAKEKAQDAFDASVSFVKKHPFYTIAGAAAVGFAAAALLRRKH